MNDDLALNQPGESLRHRSEAIQNAHPIATIVLRLFGEHSQERAWRRGAEGERAVAERLRSLGSSWRVLHGVPVGSGATDIDHLVIGPGGVFSLNTKNHLGGRVKVTSKAVYVNGSYQPYLAKSRGEGKRATKLLSTALRRHTPVQSVIVVLASDFTVQAQPDDVPVIGRNRIAKWLSAQPAVLTAEDVERIYAVARRREVWVPTGPEG